MTSQIRICIIGAGPAGLCSAHHVTKLAPGIQSSKFLLTVYEQNDKVGGTWVYDDRVGDGIHSSMYKNLSTNLPKEVMAFPDFPFPKRDDGRSFLHHTDVKNYLEDYCEHFGLETYIRLRKRVILVKPKQLGDKLCWDVTVLRDEDGCLETNEFDSVMVCNGHHTVPKFADIIGFQEHYKGLSLHSHAYREATPFTEKTVLVLGASESGCDISLEVSKVAKRVFLSHNNPRKESVLPDNMEQVTGVKECLPDGTFVLCNGDKLQNVDAFLFCTGYEFHFPFLDKSCQVECTNQCVRPLYMHLFHAKLPSLCFIGIPSLVSPIPQFHLQAQLFVKFLEGEVRLPSTESMLEEERSSIERHLASGKPLRHFHKMGTSQWDYNRQLAQMAGVQELPSFVQLIYNDTWARRLQYLTDYKKDKYKLADDGESYERSN